MRERPELEPSNLWAWEAYRRCQGGRELGMVAGDISLLELEAYCRLWRIEDRDEIEELHDYFLALDAEMRKLSKSASAEKRNDAEEPKKKAEPKGEVMKREAPATV